MLDQAGRFLAAEPPVDLPADQAARKSALDVEQSWIVQAPAGAGKTELLTQRFLKLLSIVDEPEEILAITFTRAATAEMRGRILSALEQAAAARALAIRPIEPEHAGHAGSGTLALAEAALARSEQRGWQLLEQPHRLDVQTIDSLCMRLAHGQPLLARLGGRLEPTEQAAALYTLAAQRTLERLGSEPASKVSEAGELEAALRELLLLRDNNLGNCERLIAAMLESRERWRHVFLRGDHAAVDWQAVRVQLEAPFAGEVRSTLDALHTDFSKDPAMAGELLALAQYACGNGSRADIDLLQELHALPATDPDSVEHWGAIRNFLLTKGGQWRRSVSARDGFPSDGVARRKAEQQQFKQRMLDLIGRLQPDEAAAERLRSRLRHVAALPAARYTEEQWQTLLSVFRVLRHAIAELHVVFAERNQIDFAELSIAAATVLDEEENPRGLLASESRRHLLIDEFQDTSRQQHRLIGSLLREWQPGDGRTCFLVGDPTQSIYLFRHAEVELFGRVQRRGLDCGSHTHPCADLQLSENFRSHAGLVDPLNGYFSAIFSSAAGTSRGAQAEDDRWFAPSTASAAALPGESLHVHCFFPLAQQPDSCLQARRDEIARVVSLIEEELPHIESAKARAGPDPEVREGAADGAGESPKSYRVAVLGRARSHLTPIAAALRARGIAFRAVELESLDTRQEILDLLSLLRALLHPADRIAWLSVLRAPWCGLTLGDLHMLTGADDRSLRSAPVCELAAGRGHLLTAEGKRRLERTTRVLERANGERFRRGDSLATWLERAWTSLGAPAYLSATERENAEMFFRLLDGLPPDGLDVLNGSVDAALKLLCAAPDGSVSEQFGVQLMTIHKAKGLGFDTVIVPALERAAGQDGSPLIAMLERTRPVAPQASTGYLGAGAGAAEEIEQVLVAPLGRQGEQHRTYKWIQAQRATREAGERKRLFYVACTRARRKLHLLGSAEVSAKGEAKPAKSDSLLACAWPALGRVFEQRRRDLLGHAPEVAHSGLNGLELSPSELIFLAPSRSETSVEPDQVIAGRLLRPEPGVLTSLAADASIVASADANAATASAACEDALRLFRVPADFAPRIALQNVTTGGTLVRSAPLTLQSRVHRPEGSFEQRARGNAIHAMLEFVSKRWAREGAAGAISSFEPLLDRVANTVLRRAGLSSARAAEQARATLAVVLAVADHREGRWLLEPRPGAQSEWSLSVAAADDAGRRTVRVDRSFRAGEEPLSEGCDCLWIVDYKTGGQPGGLAVEAYLEGQKELWAPQLAEYGSAMKALLREPLALRYALYFPELLRLKKWTE